MAIKTFSIGFYQGVFGDKNVKENVSDILKELLKEDTPVFNIRGYDFKLKELKQNKKTIQGILCKFRHDDIPIIGNKNNLERPIDLSDDEGLIEKNHFVYYTDQELLVYQHNKHACHYKILGEYITEITGKTCVFNPIIQKESFDSLMKGGVKPRKINVSFARPSNNNLTGHKFNSDLMKLLSDTGGLNINLTISVGRRKSKYLNMDIRDALLELVREAEPNIARLNYDDDEGGRHDIDLIADRITSSVDVYMNGRYPNSEKMFSELRSAKNEKNDQIKRVIS